MSSVKLDFSETGNATNAEFGEKLAIHHISRPLALLDYISRAHEKIKICLLSIRHLSMSQLSVAFSGAYAEANFFICGKNLGGGNFYEYFSFSLTWDPMGAKISKCYCSYKSQLKAFKILLNFLPSGPHKTMFGIFGSLKIEILTIVFRFC